MTPDRWQQVNDAFLAVASASATQRGAQLAALRDRDPELHAAVMRLLAGDQAAAHDGFLENSPLAALRERRRDSDSAVAAGSSDARLATPDGGPTHTSAPAGRLIGGREMPEVPDFDLIRPLDRGGFGEVWLARARNGVHRAIKLLPPDMLALTELRGLRTYETWAGRHPHLIDVRHVGETAAHVYYVMELADGYQAAAATFDPADYVPRTLKSDLRRRGALPLDEAVAVVRAILAGLQQLHASEVLHRDVKPANVVFVGGVAKLADIGLLAHTQSAGMQGHTPEYAPPGGVVDVSGDLYCVGRVLAELVLGRLPDSELRPPGDTPAERLAAFRELLPILRTACALPPAARYSSAEAFDRALVDAFGDLAHAGAPPGTPQAQETRPALVNRRRRPAGGFVLVAALAVAIVALVAWFSMPPAALYGELRLWVAPPGGSTDQAQPAEQVFPLRSGQLLYCEVEFSRPSYPLVAIISAVGEVDVVYPVGGAAGEASPAPVTRLRLPPGDGAWPIPAEDGALTVIVLAGSSPVADTTAIRARIAALGVPEIRPDEMLVLAGGKLEKIPAAERVRGPFSPQAVSRIRPGVVERIREEFGGAFRVIEVVAIPQRRE